MREIENKKKDIDDHGVNQQRIMEFLEQTYLREAHEIISTMYHAPVV